MKKIIAVIFSLMLILPFSACAQNSGAIRWQDAAVEGIFRQWLNRPQGPIYPHELDEVRSISIVASGFGINEAPFREVRSLPGDEGYIHLPGGATREAVARNAFVLESFADFAHCKNLYSLELVCASFESLAGIERLAGLGLTHFAVDGNPRLTSIRGLEQLSSLISLRFTSVNVANWEPVSGLAELKALNLSDVPLENLAFVEGLNKLEQFIAQYVPPVSLRPLAKLPALTTVAYADREGTQVMSMEELRAEE